MHRAAGGDFVAAMDGLLAVFLLFVAVVGAQPSPPVNDGRFSYGSFSPSTSIVVVVIVAALFFVGFFAIYIRHCSDASGAAGSVGPGTSMMRNRRTRPARGLDASVIETFPTFTYSEVKHHKIGKEALECAVCLNEFAEDETLRLIPKCDHVFHPECIDAWLESHVTCPVCRADLAAPDGGEQVTAPDLTASAGNGPVGGEVERINSLRNEEIVIQVDEVRPRPVDHDGGDGEKQSSFETPMKRSWSVKKILGFDKFRSHSTGHSIIQRSGENHERFTLKLPAEVRNEIMIRSKLTRTGSTAASFKTGGAGEGSSRRGRLYRRLQKLDAGGKSDRWILFTRGLSMKSPKVSTAAESSESGGRRLPVKMPSFNCLEPKTGADDIETRLFTDGRSAPPL